MNRPQNYHPITKSFHWIVVALVGVQFLVGWIMPDIRGNSSPEALVSFHMSFGLVILLVMLLRVLWWATHPNPRLLTGSPWWQNLTAKLVHYALYILLVILPITGWLIASARGWSVNLFGLFNAPNLIAPNPSSIQLYVAAHVATVLLVALLIAGHAFMVLYHHFIVKDTVLKRMLPAYWTK
jgi:cytochrome b561